MCETTHLCYSLTISKLPIEDLFVTYFPNCDTCGKPLLSEIFCVLLRTGIVEKRLWICGFHQYFHNLKTKFTDSRYVNTYKFQEHDAESNKTSLYITSHNLISYFKDVQQFHCDNFTYISYKYICDGHIDCPGTRPVDEEECICNDTDYYSSKCKYIGKNTKEITCSKFFVKIRQNHCKWYRSVGYDNDETYGLAYSQISTNFKNSNNHISCKKQDNLWMCLFNN